MNLSEAIRHIKERISLVDLVGRYVELKRNGLRYSAPCPFHQETKPSFSVNAEKGFYYCFGCQASGDLIEFYSRINGIDFRESVEQLAQEIGINVDFASPDGRIPRNGPESKSRRQQILKMYDFAARIYSSNLQEKDSLECREYLIKRNTSPDIIERFELGWAPRSWRFLADRLKRKNFDADLAVEAGLLGKAESGNYYDRFRGRLMFPIKNISGQTIAFGGRIIDASEEAKYINSAESAIYKKKENLYGLFQARRTISSKGQVFLTEGYMDVLTLHQFGYTNSVAALGTALTDEQVQRLSGLCSSFLLIFDGDKPGRKAALRAAGMLLGRGLKCNVAILPPEDDIDSLLKQKGNEYFDKLAASAPDGIKYCSDALRQMAPADAVEWVKEFLANVHIGELANYYATAFSAYLNIEETSLRKHVADNRSRRHEKRYDGAEPFEGQDKQILIFAARYPERLAELRSIGAELMLKTEKAKDFWKKLQSCPTPELPGLLDEEQKAFWLRQRGPCAPPLSDGNFEFECLEKALNTFYQKTKKVSLARALADTVHSADFQAQLEYLRALQETLEKSDEQS